MSASRTDALTAERLRELLSYDEESGEWTWLVDRGGTAKKGSLAGSINPDGYRRIRIEGRLYLASRLAVLHQTGAWPKDMVDHRDRDPSNNRFNNLRPATRSQNCANMVRPRRVKPELPRGVWLNGKGFRAQIRHNNKLMHIGTFSTPEAASAAYRRAATELHGEFALRQ